MRKPVDKTKESIEQAIAHTAERQEEARRSRIDIDMGDGYARQDKESRRRTRRAAEAAEEPAQEEAPAVAFPAPAPVVPAETEKLEALERAAAAMQETPGVCSAGGSGGKGGGYGGPAGGDRGSGAAGRTG